MDVSMLSRAASPAAESASSHRTCSRSTEVPITAMRAYAKVLSALTKAARQNFHVVMLFVLLY